jgi:hypothetical protein
MPCATPHRCPPPTVAKHNPLRGMAIELPVEARKPAPAALR